MDMVSKRLTKFLNCRYDDVPFEKRWLMRIPVILLKYGSLVPVPAAVVTFFLLMTAKEWTLVSKILLFWSICEIWFFLSWKKRMAQPFKRKPFAIDLKERVAFINYFLTHAENIEEVMANWIIERPKGRIYLEQFKPFINDMLLDDSELTQVDAEEIYHIFNEKIPSNPAPDQPLESHRFMNPAKDPFPYQPKPMFVYMAMQLIRTMTFSKLHNLGFRSYVTRDLAYWILTAHSQEPPIMYIHGIGMGYCMYLPKLLVLLEAYPGRGVILLDLPHISMTYTESILGHDQTLKALDAMFIRHNLEKVALVGQSYGTIVSSWIIKHRPQYLARVVLVDPVCFMMWDSTMAYSFLYEDPKCMSHELMRFFVAMDPLISHTISKGLYWYESVLYPEDITIPTTIFLAEDDWIVDPVAISTYLQKRLPSHCQIILLDTYHGGLLFHRDYYLQFIQAL